MATNTALLRKFTSFQGDAALFKITESASPEFADLAKRFPAAVARALKSLGWYAQKSMKDMIRAGGPSGGKWLELSDVRRYRRMERLKAGEFPRRSYRGMKKKGTAGKWVAPGLSAKAKDTPDPSGVFGKVAQTIAYRKPQDKNMVEIGALSPSAADFLSAVQEGKRGGKGSFQFTGRQVVTPAMRRAFWAAGFPLSEETTMIGQEGRALVPPAFKELHPEIERYLVGRITSTLAKQGIDWMKQ